MPLGRRTTYQFDAASRKTLRIDARGIPHELCLRQRQPPLRLSVIPTARGSPSPTTMPAAARCSVTATGRTTTTYDADGRLQLVVNPAGLRLTYAYDAASRRKYLIEPEGARFTYVFDADGRTSYVANPQAQRATWSYDAASRVTGIHFANTTRASYFVRQRQPAAARGQPDLDQHDALELLIRAGRALATACAWSNRAGNRVTWSYDNTYQLKNEQRSGSNTYNITYTYDPVGNRLVLINGGVRTTSTYDAANELTKSQASAGIDDDHLRRERQPAAEPDPSNQRTSYTWDFENRLTQVALPSASPNTFTYNGDGQRVQKQDSTGTTKHVWDGQNILLETDGSNIIQVVYTLQPELYGNLISQRQERDDVVLPVRRAGSTTQLANSTGA